MTMPYGSSPEKRGSGNRFLRPSDVVVAQDTTGTLIEGESRPYKNVQDEVLADHLGQISDTLREILFQLQYITEMHGEINE